MKNLRAIVSALACAAALPGPVARAADCPERLRIAFPDAASEPFIRGQGEFFAQERPGLLVEWVRAATRQLGCGERAELLRLPTRRVRAMVEGGQLDLVAGVAPGGPLGALLLLPPPDPVKRELDYSLGQVDYALYARRGSPAATAWDGQRLRLGPDDRVGVGQGSRSESLAQERRWPMEPAPSHESALQKLAAGRTALLLVHGFFLDERLAREPALSAQITRLAPPVERRRLHVGATHALEQSHPGFVLRLWRELCRQSQASRAEGACQLPK